MGKYFYSIKTATLGAFIILSLKHSPLLAFEGAVKGFIALDALNFEKVEGQRGSSVIGIGVLDLKVFAEEDNLAAALKLDLDGKLEKQYSLFEEAYATYKGLPKWRFSLGKGVVRFQNLHWGALINSYQDGGTVIGTENSFRKLSRKAFLAVSYGGRAESFINQFSIWGDSNEMEIGQDGKVVYDTSGSGSNLQIRGMKTKDVVAFDTKKQLGLANKLEYFATDNFKINQGLVYYKNRFHDHATYALDLGFVYESDKMEIWFDSIWGKTHKLPYENFSTLNKKEFFAQLGGEYYLNEKWSYVQNLEYLWAKDQQHSYANFTESGITYSPKAELLEKSNKLNVSKVYKIDTALKYKLTSSAHLAFGGVYEKKKATQNGVKDLKFIRDVLNANRDAFKVAATVSFWF